MRLRLFPVGLLAAAMLLSGVTTYGALGNTRTHVLTKAPTQSKPAAPAFQLPGTVYLAQGGAIYSLRAGVFTQLTPAAGWSQPSLFPNGTGLLAVKRDAAFSDVYRMGLDGSGVTQLTHNAASRFTRDTGANHWSFYPRLAPDGATVYMSYDSAKFGDYEVDSAIWAVPMGAAISRGVRWSTPNSYTGGDLQPLPLASGALLYVKYDQDADGTKASQIMYVNRRLSAGKALTTLADDCSQPALSPDGTTLAMICSYKQQTSQLVLASFDGVNLGPLRIVVSDLLVAQPTWAPDGSGIAFLAPALADAPFQLWFLPRAAYTAPPVATPSPSPSAKPSPSPAHPGKASPTPRPTPRPSPKPSPSPTPVKPIQMTTDLGLDATSAIAWRA
jgi:hypothetical protein